MSPRSDKPKFGGSFKRSKVIADAMDLNIPSLENAGADCMASNNLKSGR